MEEKKMTSNREVGIGTILSPGSYKIEEEVMMLRVRVTGTPLFCLIDGERRVKEIVSAPAAAMDSRQETKGEVAFDSANIRENWPGPKNEEDRQKYAAAVDHLAGKFEVALQRFTADGRSCLSKMAAILDRGNFHLTSEFRDGGAAGLKAYLIRELFKRTVREERGFKILLLLSHVIAFTNNGQPERLEQMSLEQQKKLLKEFMDFLKVAGHKRVDPRIFEEIYEKFNDQEFTNLNRGGVGFFIKPLYDKEMQELKSAITNSQNSNYIEQLYSNSNRESVDFLYENTLAYLKALAIVRLYAKSNRKERGGDSKTVEQIIRDLINFRPAWIKVANHDQALTA
ncbi:MAG: hypothetical protein MUP71_08375 [Candidatus Aminicenantes bacterium]|nr:hypothetical protein [Candidatus Aminicenantes bacterium]